MLSSSLTLAHTVQVTRTTQVYYLGWIALVVLSIINYLGAKSNGLTFTDPEYYMITLAVLASTCLLFYGIFGHNSRVGEMIRYLALWLAYTLAGSIFTYLLASLCFPLVDSRLDSFDKALGFHWLDWYNFVNAHSVVKFVLVNAYTSMTLQIAFSIVFFSHLEKSDSNNELWWIAIISLVITTIISGVLPAMGTFEYYGVVDAKHGTHLRDLHALRDGIITSFSLEYIQGIVTLPSFHTVMAILLVYIYRDQRHMLFIAVPLNLLMLVSIPSEGGHYLGDMLAGCIVAALSIWIARNTVLKPQNEAQILELQDSPPVPRLRVSS
jgi:hypothetical protein